ncbi:MAG: carboxypeptidase-like regulatory domain-containing protein [Bacteroidales bacterium]|nr:MAG: carboxypeptidase-like regulatory domain-containing protein [Bacteroidales bacterium]
MINHAAGQDSIFNYNISLTLRNYSVYDALKVIEKDINYNFSYNSSLIDADRIISVNYINTSLKEILDTILCDENLRYRTIDKNIVIYKPGSNINKIIAEILSDSVPLLKIRGKIIDDNSREPVEYANISIVGKSIGTVSNSDGEFILKITPAFIYDTLGISYIGYKIYKQPLANLLAGNNIIYLVPDYIPIQEVIIRKIDPVLLLRNAIEKIPVNYSRQPSMLTSFYRESVRESRRYVIVTEAVLQTYKSPYSRLYENDQIKIIKARKSQDVTSADSVILKLKAGLSTTLLLDIIKHPANFLINDDFEYYSYKMADVMIDNEKEAYVIRFDHRGNNDYPPFTGRIYLDLNSLAIKAVDFSLKENKIEKASHIFVIKKPRNFKVKPLKAEYMVKFIEFSGKYYLNFIRCETEFKIRKKKQFFGKVFNSVIEMAVTDIDTTNVKRFKAREVAKTMNIFTDQVSDYNELYWEEYNTIKPDEPLEEAIRRLSSGE